MQLDRPALLVHEDVLKSNGLADGQVVQLAAGRFQISAFIAHDLDLPNRFAAHATPNLARHLPADTGFVDVNAHEPPTAQYVVLGTQITGGHGLGMGGPSERLTRELEEELQAKIRATRGLIHIGTDFEVERKVGTETYQVTRHLREINPGLVAVMSAETQIRTW